jgi:hypothetical protein
MRNAMRFVSYQDRKKIAASMRTIYTAPSLEAAEVALSLDPPPGLSPEACRNSRSAL